MTLFSCLGLCKTKNDQLKVDCRPTAENCLEINDTQREYSKLMKTVKDLLLFILSLPAHFKVSLLTMCPS